MDLGIEGKKALVLGGGGGLGSEIAETLASEGVTVAIADINETAVQELASEIKNKGGAAVPITWDLSDTASITSNLRDIESSIGSIDILVAITGGPPPGEAGNQPVEIWRSHFDSMIVSVIETARQILPGMRERKWGRIIVSTSSGVVAPIPNLGVSNALRMTLVGWSKTVAGEIGRDGVTCNVIIPGRIATKRITFLDEKKAEKEGRTVDEIRADSISSIPVGRYGKPSEYADVVAFLASQNAAYVTGTQIRVDGGYIPSI